METRTAYNQWAAQYDTNENKTRDLEAKALRECLSTIAFDDCLEIGCGTGKNTAWLYEKCRHITAVDFSEEMLAKAKEKLFPNRVNFVRADINEDWNFTNEQFDLVTFSLVLEHIRDLDAIFAKAATKLRPGGTIYIGELHPFKQYQGSKARFETESGTQEVPCHTHNISEFLSLSAKNGFILRELREYFDDDATGEIPRILSIVLKKS